MNPTHEIRAYRDLTPDQKTKYKKELRQDLYWIWKSLGHASNITTVYLWHKVRLHKPQMDLQDQPNAAPDAIFACTCGTYEIYESYKEA